MTGRFGSFLYRIFSFQFQNERDEAIYLLFQKIFLKGHVRANLQPTKPKVCRAKPRRQSKVAINIMPLKRENSIDACFDKKRAKVKDRQQKAVKSNQSASTLKFKQPMIIRTCLDKFMNFLSVSISGQMCITSVIWEKFNPSGSSQTLKHLAWSLDKVCSYFLNDLNTRAVFPYWSKVSSGRR